MERIVAATDLTLRGAPALLRAAKLAREFRVPLTLLHVVDEDLPDALRRSQQLQAKGLLDAEVDRLGSAYGIEVEAQVEVGSDAYTIARTAEALGADWVVVGSSQPLLEAGKRLGSATKRLMRETDLPLLVVRNDVEGGYRRVLVAIDLIDASRRVLGLAHRLAETEPLQVLHVPQDPAGRDSTDAAATYTDPAARAALESLLANAGFEAGAATPLIRLGQVDNLLPRVADEVEADLVAIGTTTQAKGAVERWLMGSHAEHALSHVVTDLLIVPLEAS
ncbi:MAG: universal stress protein [Geminicoccaceae bacterium]|nr:MAG: universal stress protein [Geminicoccaceae bacterium]